MEIYDLLNKYNFDDKILEKLYEATSKKAHKKLWYKLIVKSRHSNDTVINEILIDLELAKWGRYCFLFPNYSREGFFDYSPLLEVILEYKAFYLSYRQTQKMKVQIGYYMHTHLWDLSIDKFENFKPLARRIDWPKIIQYNIRNHSIMTKTSMKMIRDSTDNLFAKSTGTVYYKPCSLYEFRVFIALGIYFKESFLYKVITGDSLISIGSLDAQDLLMSYIRLEESISNRYKDVHSQYLVMSLPRVTIHNFEGFYQYMQSNSISDSFKVLARLL